MIKKTQLSYLPYPDDSVVLRFHKDLSKLLFKSEMF
jgi:hypothetical protein